MTGACQCCWTELDVYADGYDAVLCAPCRTRRAKTGPAAAEVAAEGRAGISAAEGLGVLEVQRWAGWTRFATPEDTRDWRYEQGRKMAALAVALGDFDHPPARAPEPEWEGRFGGRRQVN